MPAARDSSHIGIQLGMANPPRKAKRLRELASKEYTEVSSVSSMRCSPTPSATRLSPPLADTSRRRGRKPAGPMSRTAREQLRKTNHSIIEKRRREKINDALAALRELVPNGKEEGEKKEEKEFKLEILVRTVEYLRMVVARVKILEEGRCEECRGALATPPRSLPKERPPLSLGKRKHPDDEDAVMDLGDDGGGLEGAHPSIADPPIFVSIPETPTSPQRPIPRLPSISTWMPRSPFEDAGINSRNFQLLSPPQSAPFAPTQTSTGFLPRLALPSPIGPSPTGTSFTSHHGSPQSASASPFFTPLDRDVPEMPLDGVLSIRTPSTVSAVGSSPGKQGPPEKPGVSGRSCGSPVSPWTRDDQTAASLLLNISSHRCRATSAETKSRVSGREIEAGSGVLEAQTPSSVLGMGDGRLGL